MRVTSQDPSARERGKEAAVFIFTPTHSVARVRANSTPLPPTGSRVHIVSPLGPRVTPDREVACTAQCPSLRRAEEVCGCWPPDHPTRCRLVTESRVGCVPLMVLLFTESRGKSADVVAGVVAGVSTAAVPTPQ